MDQSQNFIRNIMNNTLMGRVIAGFDATNPRAFNYNPAALCDDGSWPKVDSNSLPSECKGSGDDNPDCWMEGKPSLSELTHGKRQSICCTSRNDFMLAEQYWGIPYLISKASKKYDDSKLIRANNLN